MGEKKHRKPAVTWIKVADFMTSWLQKELGGDVRIGSHSVLCLNHLPGARDVLRMATEEDRMNTGEPAVSMSATRHSCMEAGIALDTDTVEQMYGMTRNDISWYVPVECPRTCLTQDGVLRPWTDDVRFGREQAAALQRILRRAFWRGMEEYDREYASNNGGKRYAAVDMIEAFCRDTGTSDLYIDALRREWQRRKKRLNIKD
jgi:hypothetical protein